MASCCNGSMQAAGSSRPLIHKNKVTVSVPESSRNLNCSWSEEAQCSWGPILSTTSCPVPRDCSDWWFYSVHWIANLPVYQCTKFGALNPRINKTRSDIIWFLPLHQVQTPRFYILVIFWLSNLAKMYPRASGTIMDCSLYVSSHLNASILQAMEWDSKWKFSLKNMFHWSGFCLSS